MIITLLIFYVFVSDETPVPFVFFTKSWAVVNAWSILCQIAPAHAADWWLKMTGREPKYAKLMHNVIAIRNAVDYFTAGVWPMKSDRARDLISSLSEEDQEKFPCNPSHINWQEYIRDYCNGVFRYLKARN
ncbi:fatty acyl-CoA reductase 2-like [Trichoplusia ni]|uniref:Fatty acyl-CoA reductase 2-like n=1 Tax=Trichoplusia ni TaxID=7111 RepID=A0A7E5VWR8_TRINI|nr:fatty acyl-CoA reductase 2-like [Trichoplusia ni]